MGSNYENTYRISTVYERASHSGSSALCKAEYVAHWVSGAERPARSSPDLRIRLGSLLFTDADDMFQYFSMVRRRSTLLLTR